MLRNATFQRMEWMRRLWTVVPWWRGPHGIKLLLDTKTADSLLTPIGVLAWTALLANWKVRNAAKASPEGRFTDAYFFRVWTNILSPFV